MALNLKNAPVSNSRIILGCMRMPALNVENAANVIQNAYEHNINFFDHATCYGGGEAEERFGQAFKNLNIKRADVIIQSKCGLRFENNTFDWSKDYIISSVDSILKRLDMEYLDVLLLHRPDLLFDPEEVAEAFDELEKNGKVRNFGVSNTMPMQIELLKKYVKQPIIINQLQLSLEQSQLIDQDLYMNNMTTDYSIMRDGSALNYCRLNDITIQAWSPLQHGMFGGNFVDNPDFPEINKALAELSDKYNISKTAIAISWILRHPANIQVIAGTMNPTHLNDLCQAESIRLSHEDWYKLYLSSGKFLP